MGILKIYYGVLLLTAILNIPGSESRAIEGNMHTVPKMKTNSHISNTEDTNHCTDNGICRCRRSNDKVLVADCSYLKLTTIPTFHPDVSVIHLQGNELQQLSGQGISKAVSFLDLSENKLNSFVGLPFKGMNRLKNLNLSNNKLQYRNSIFSDDVFHGLTSLIHLNMKQNNIEFSLRNVHFPSGISNLTTLEELFLDGVDLSGFDVKFLMLKKLKTLSLSGDTGVCHLGVLRSDFFTNVPNVETLDISNCNIHRIDLETFRCLENLRSLNISNNDCLTFRVLANVTNDLQYTPIRLLDISRLHCTFGPGTVLQKTDILHLEKTNLTHVYLDSNRLAMVEVGFARLLPKTLTFISIVDNKLSFGLYDFELMTSLPNIEIIHAESEGRPHNMESGSSDCNDWRAPPSSHETISFGRSNELLNCNRNPLLKLHHNSETITTVPLPPSLREFYFSNNAMNFEIGKVKFRENNLTSIDLSNNLLHSWKGPLLNLKKLKHVDLSNNFCSYVSEDFLKGLTILETLELGNNLLGLVLHNDTKGKLFRNLKRLKTLDLSANHISTLPTVLLRNQYELQTLNLSNNALVEFDLDISQIRNLKYLDLSLNAIRTIKSDQRLQIKSLTDNNITVNLKGNRMSCSCENLDFLKWLSNNKVLFENFTTYKCVLRNETEISFSNIAVTLTELTKSCDSYIGIIAVFASLILLSLSLTICGIVYRYRWKLRYLFYMAKTRYKGYTPVANAEHDDDFIYDAFISYCSDDVSFVRDDLISNLEDNRGLRLCLHQRDFIPGQDIAQNITNAIHQSRKTVVILSRHYLDSYWCLYEFNMARMESIYSREGDSVLLLVFYEDIPAKELPFTLMDLIDSKSYLEYPHDDVHGKVVFWDKLAESVSV